MNARYHVSSSRGKPAIALPDRFLLTRNGLALHEWDRASLDGTEPHSMFLLSLFSAQLAGVEGRETLNQAVDEWKSWIRGAELNENLYDGDLKNKLQEGFKRVHELMMQQSAIRDDGAKMQSSAAILIMGKTHAVLAHVGNARIYRFRDKVLEQLTDDHTEAWQLVKAGKISPEKVKTYPGHRQLTQLLGGLGQQSPKPGLQTIKLESADTFLLVSSGLLDGISDRFMQDALVEATSKSGTVNLKALDKILAQALAQSGKDDSTVIGIQLEAPAEQESKWSSMIRKLD
jgi:serine/threonine protein phosphatase PrpC